jgi:putative flippase GtrA
MSASMTRIGVKIRANSCGAHALRGIAECARKATSWQTIVGEPVALRGPEENSLHAHTFVGRLRGFGRHTGREKATEIGENSTGTATLVRWCKFNLVGALGICVQFGVLFLLKSVLRCNYLAASALAVEAAVVHNFFWHERFTWADRARSDRTKPERVRPSRGKSLPRFLRFNLTTGLVSIGGNLGMMRVMVGRAHLHYLAANGIAIAVCSLVNFVVSDGWVFGE